MAVVSAQVKASPSQVFSVLAEGWYYSDWVVGTSHVRAVESNWPAAGSRLFHAAGVWPMVIRDVSTVEAVHIDKRLVLTASGRPFGHARVTIELTATETGTTVTIDEVPVAGPGKWFDNPVAEALLARRNTETLARLAALVERRTSPADG
jgi:hypothetical protein